MRDEMLLECLNCKDNFIGTTHIDGYSCPRCGGMIVPKGHIKELKRHIRETEIKIKSALYNGNIKDVAEKERLKKKCNKKCVCGVDSGSGKEPTVFTIHVDIDELTNINKVARRFDKFLKTKCVDVIE